MNSRNSNIVKTLNEMFLQRDYVNIINDLENNRISAIKPNNEKMFAFTNILEKLNVSEIHNFICKLHDEKVNHGLLVYEGIPTSAVKNAIVNAPNIGLTIELFQADDLQFNITKHRLVPCHKRLTKEESKELKEREKYPILLRNDAVSRFYNFEKGDIVKITRRDGFISFRIVR